MWQIIKESLKAGKNFYSHIPCGMWQIFINISCINRKFLLTHPVWDVTMLWQLTDNQCIFLLTHPVWDVTAQTAFKKFFDHISTHTSRVGCDEKTRVCGKGRLQFLLTHPVWDVTRFWIFYKRTQTISTHTSRVGCDQYKEGGEYEEKHFYSHIPCGMWPVMLFNNLMSAKISTHTSRVGCDSLFCSHNIFISISTHTSRVGCDRYI